MAEATVELLLKVKMVKRFGKVGPVKVSVHPEHLAEDSLAYVDKILRKPAPSSNPVSIKLRCGHLGVKSIRNSGGISRKNIGIIDLSRNPTLHKCYIFISRQFNGFSTIVEPGKGMVSRKQLEIAPMTGMFHIFTYVPADIRGQVVGLQIEIPSSSFSCTTRTKFHKLR